MTSGRVVAIAYLLTSFCAFAQQSSIDSAKSADAKAKPQAEVAVGAPGVLVPAQSSPNILNQFQSPENANVNVCFKMRTYVMARDSKDSDSTHLVRYSTCTPANARIVQKTAHPVEAH